MMANVKGGRYVASLSFPIVNPVTGQEHYPGQSGNWRFSQETVQQLLEDDEIWFGKNGDSRPKLKRFLSDVKKGVTYPSIWDFVPMNTSGSSEMLMLFGDGTAFESPKPMGLIQEIMKLGTTTDSIILDSFAGSGTTAHAVLALNHEDGGNRKFILVESEDYADSITAERVRRVIHGVPDARGAALQEGLGGSFTYCTLGDPIDLEAMLTGDALPDYPALAAYLLHVTAGVSAGDVVLERQDDDGLYHHDDKTAYYLLYEPDLDYLSSNEAMLDEQRARRISTAIRQDDRKAIVFGAGKYIGQRDLTAMGITFCQLPYEMHRAGQ